MSPTNDEVTPQRQGFERLYEETRVGILGYLLRRVGSAPNAADLLAETYLIAWRKIDTVPNDETARLWLYGVARPGRVSNRPRCSLRWSDRGFAGSTEGE